MKQYKLLRAWSTFKANDIVELDEETAKALVLAEAAVEHDEVAALEAEKAEKAQSESISAAVESAVAKAIENSNNDGMRLHVEVTHEEADDGFNDLGEQLKAIKSLVTEGTRDDRLDGVARKAASGSSELVDADGGFLVDPDIQAGLTERIYDTGVLLSRTRTVEVSGNGLVWKELSDYDRTSRPVSAYWTEEAGTKTSSKPTFKERRMALRKLAGLYYATDELLEDASALGSMAAGWFTREFGFEIDSAIMNGNGAGQPLGYRNSDAAVTVAKVGSQTADTVNATNVTNMYARMPAYLQAGAVWLINQDVFPQLPLMSIGDAPVFLGPGNDIKAAPGGMLLGHPVMMSEHCSTLGDLGDIQYVNLGEYILIRKGMLKTDTSIHVKFTTDETAFRFVMRLNGQPLPSDKITPAKGTKYQSPFIQLAERA